MTTIEDQIAAVRQVQEHAGFAFLTEQFHRMVRELEAEILSINTGDEKTRALKIMRDRIDSFSPGKLVETVIKDWKNEIRKG